MQVVAETIPAFDPSQLFVSSEYPRSFYKISILYAVMGEAFAIGVVHVKIISPAEFVVTGIET